jgi:H/ACA ribonucleoprotein complex subunit 4
MSSALSQAQAKVASAQQQGDFSIKPEAVQPVLSTSEWPLLLKNYDKLLVRSSHFTPIPSGCSPLKRDITSYIKLKFRATPALFWLTVLHLQIWSY